MENLVDNSRIFDLGVLKTNPPKRRGLSRYYSGKSRSFACMTEVQCLEDLKKQEHLDAHKKKRYPERKETPIPPSPCRRAYASSQCLSPCIGVKMR